MRNALLILLTLVICGCAESSAVRPNARAETEFEQKYAEWEAEVERKLETESSSSHVSDDFTRHLSAHAHEHEPFLTRKLEQNMFVVNILNKSDVLRKKYNDPGRTAGNKQASRTAWLKAMRRSHNKPDAREGL
jgi:hypothetical protein